MSVSLNQTEILIKSQLVSNVLLLHHEGLNFVLSVLSGEGY